jgi:hypothetical protein
MKSSISFLVIAFILAGIAAFLNYQYIQAKVPATVYLTLLNSDIQQGDVIQESMFTNIQVVKSDYTGLLPENYLQPQDISILVGVAAEQDYRKGTLLQRNDIGNAEPLNDYSILGPFRLLAIGEQIITGTEDQNRNVDSNVNSVTIAVKESFFGGRSKEKIKQESDAAINAIRLIQIIENQKSSSSSYSNLRIVGVVAYNLDKPLEKVSEGNANNANVNVRLEKDEVALIVPLSNVETIPEVLLTSKEPKIGFIVPTLALPAKVKTINEKIE